MRRLGLILSCILFGGCGSNASDKQALETYFSQRPNPTILSEPGIIRSVECHRRGITFRGADVYACDVHYARGADGEVCGARVGGKIVTHGLPRNCIP